MSESMKNQDIRPSLSFPAFQGEAASRKAGRKSLMLYPECCGEALSKERSEEAGRECSAVVGWQSTPAKPEGSQMQRRGNWRHKE